MAQDPANIRSEAIAQLVKMQDKPREQLFRIYRSKEIEKMVFSDTLQRLIVDICLRRDYWQDRAKYFGERRNNADTRPLVLCCANKDVCQYRKRIMRDLPLALQERQTC